jgi:uncharacterized protein DUF2846
MKVSNLMLIAVFFCLSSLALAAPAGSFQEQEKKQKAEKEEDEPKTESEKAKKKELEQKACGLKEVDYKARTDKKQHPAPDPPSDKAAVYVIRPTMMGNKVQSKLAVDGEWKGVNRGDNYFYFNLDPGEHYFCSKAENSSVLSLKVEAGKTYYLQQKIQMGFMKARNKLVALNDEEGKKGLAKCHLSIAEEKK